MPAPQLSSEDVHIIRSLILEEVQHIQEIERNDSVGTLKPYLDHLELIEHKLLRAVPGLINPSGQDSSKNPPEGL